MKIEGNSIVEPSESAVKEWTDRCNDSSEGKIWLQCNNWYMKGTKDDEKAGRKKSKAMWMESYESYLEYLIGEKGGFEERTIRVLLAPQKNFFFFFTINLVLIN